MIGLQDSYETIMALIRQILLDQANALKTAGLGLVQGSPLSPLLANLYLDALDEEIEAKRHRFKIPCAGEEFRQE